MDAFEDSFRWVVGVEGAYGVDRADGGNWTGGAVGHGILKGTKYGISAASYPNLDIRNLTLAQAQAIYRRDFWDKLHGDSLHPALALLMFDASVNNGLGGSVHFLQRALGVGVDGVMGPGCLAAIARHADLTVLCGQVLAERIMFMSQLATWPHNAGGWSHRLAALAVRVGTYFPLAKDAVA